MKVSRLAVCQIYSQSFHTQGIRCLVAPPEGIWHHCRYDFLDQVPKHHCKPIHTHAQFCVLGSDRGYQHGSVCITGTYFCSSSNYCKWIIQVTVGYSCSQSDISLLTPVLLYSLRSL